MSEYHPDHHPTEHYNEAKDKQESHAASVLDLLGSDDPLHKDIETLLEHNHSPHASSNHHSSEAQMPGELEQLRQENQLLRRRIEELEQIIEATTSQTEEIWGEQQKEYETLLEEKSEVIRSLHHQLQELKETNHGNGHGGRNGQRLSGQESAALQEELNRLRCEIDIERRQLEEDEKAMMDQMRQMEMAMSKERVEMARQRTELQRQLQEFQHEIENAHKDSSLRERLLAIQARRHSESTNQNGNHPPARRAMPTQMALGSENPPSGLQEQEHSHQSSGLLRRMFGGK